MHKHSQAKWYKQWKVLVLLWALLELDLINGKKETCHIMQMQPFLQKSPSRNFFFSPCFDLHEIHFHQTI